MARGFEVRENCDHRDADTEHVINMDVKYWVQDRYVKPFETIDMPGYLAVLDDP